jgi:hypothetical protein
VAHARWNCHEVDIVSDLQSIEAKLHKETNILKPKN